MGLYYRSLILSCKLLFMKMLTVRVHLSSSFFLIYIFVLSFTRSKMQTTRTSVSVKVVWSNIDVWQYVNDIFILHMPWSVGSIYDCVFVWTDDSPSMEYNSDFVFACSVTKCLHIETMCCIWVFFKWLPMTKLIELFSWNVYLNVHKCFKRWILWTICIGEVVIVRNVVLIKLIIRVESFETFSIKYIREFLCCKHCVFFYWCQ